MRVGEAITRLGDELEALSAARAQHWPVRGEERGLTPADTKAALDRLRRERVPAIRAIREELSRGLTGLRTEGRGAPGGGPPRGTVAAALQEVDPELLAHSTESRVQVRGSLAAHFFARYAPSPRAGVEVPYLFLQVTGGFRQRPKVWHAHRWVFRYRRHDASQAVARAARRMLEERGVAVFLDERDFRAGDDWRERLPHLVEQAHVFVAGFFLDGAAMPTPERLPPELRDVPRRNFRPVHEAGTEAGARAVVAELVALGVVS